MAHSKNHSTSSLIFVERLITTHLDAEQAKKASVAAGLIAASTTNIDIELV